jgi:hypothetical protein
MPVLKAALDFFKKPNPKPEVSISYNGTPQLCLGWF